MELPPGRWSSPQALWPSWLSGPVLGLALVLLIFIALLSYKGQLRIFLSLGNLQLLLHSSCIAAVVALGMLIIMVSGGIDLSVGSVVALASVAAAHVYNAQLARTGSLAAASLAAIPVGVLVGGGCGLVNGLAITRLRVPPFVATLGMLSIARGAGVWLSARTPIPLAGDERPAWVTEFSLALVPQRQLFDGSVWVLFALAVLMTLVLRYTVFGRYCYAIGSNEQTARLCGIPIDRYKVAIYTLAGLFTGWAGILAMAQGDSGDPGAYVGLELDVIAALVIGGTSLSGGQGTVGGMLLGVLILAILENGVNSLGVPIEVKYILIGVIVILNTALGRWQRQRSL
jgi:ribose transport system permease protein